MSKHDDWHDDYIIMEMLEEDERHDDLAPSENSGCLPGILWAILILYVFLKLIG